MFKTLQPTLKPIDFIYEQSLNKVEETWCIYTHTVNGTLRYIGCCKLHEVFRCPDARRNTSWQEIVRPCDKITLEIIATTENQHEAQNNAYIMRNKLRPHCNVYGRQPNSATPVVCIETGQRWETSSAACKAEGIAQATMSHHLNERPGYRSIHGKHYSRVK